MKYGMRLCAVLILAGCSSGASQSATSLKVTYDDRPLAGSGTLRASAIEPGLSLSATTAPDSRIRSLSFDLKIGPGEPTASGLHFAINESKISEPVLGVGRAIVLSERPLVVVDQDGGPAVEDPNANAAPPPPPGTGAVPEGDIVEDVIQMRIVRVSLDLKGSGNLSGSLGWVDDRQLDYLADGDLPVANELLLDGTVRVICEVGTESGLVSYWPGPFDSTEHCADALGSLGK